MIQSIIAYEFKGLLYIMSACLMFLIITPQFMFANYRRKILFILILFVLTFFYTQYEDIDPLIYGIHLTPVSLALAALFEGFLPGIFTWAAFNICTIVMMDDFVPTVIGSTLLLVLGLTFHYKQVLRSTYWQICLISMTLITIYLLGFLSVFDDWDTVSGTEVGIAVVGTYLSSMYVSYIYNHVKNQEKMREELFSAEKYQVIGQLAASISHEIRNPLTTAQGFLQLMNRDNLTPAQLETYRNYAISGIEQANSIITDYLNYAKPAVELARPIHIQEEIDGIIPMMSPLCVISKIEVVIKHLSKQPIYVMGEAKKFQQCLLNIMKNAVESMPDGGVMTVTTWSDNEGVHIHVKDTGVGMSDYQIKRIGMPFYTTKEKGTGLGLMVVISLVKAMNGTISYYSRPDEGTTCVLKFKQLLL
ncbi:HAMP domain-containing histidine kinase [Paenibacillus sp. MER TA 81-3]|uniref:sensor histidine kinase n=1 Tax=Paenibacillus sp. MER TA 81-3 TaxID=2939573 RepID=UPI00203DC757|nr:HAMP domain-containing sensor histidine kinase [Paenibacillus sp. MER TA 81-3]MCM3340134.1 HAMP domain-containing histidine kinase [Paenibacillus sp. MER TA 81-3]